MSGHDFDLSRILYGICGKLAVKKLTDMRKYNMRVMEEPGPTSLSPYSSPPPPPRPNSFKAVIFFTLIDNIIQGGIINGGGRGFILTAGLRQPSSVFIRGPGEEMAPVTI